MHIEFIRNQRSKNGKHKKNIGKFVDKMLASSSTVADLQGDLRNKLPTLADDFIKENQQPFSSDRLIYRITVMALGLTLVTVIFGSIYLTAINLSAEIPEILTALGSAAVGALAGLLTPTSNNEESG